MMTITLEAKCWTVRVSARMRDNPVVSLYADCRVKKVSKVVISSDHELEYAHVDLLIGDTYSKPKPPALVKQRDSLMDLTPRPLGVMHFFDRNMLGGQCFVGSQAYDDLLHRHRNGAALPDRIVLQVEGVEYRNGEFYWDMRERPELAIVGFTFYTTARISNGRVI